MGFGFRGGEGVRFRVCRLGSPRVLGVRVRTVSAWGGQSVCSASQTLNQKNETSNPKAQTLKPKPQTLSHKPQTLNPKTPNLGPKNPPFSKAAWIKNYVRHSHYRLELLCKPKELCKRELHLQCQCRCEMADQKVAFVHDH